MSKELIRKAINNASEKTPVDFKQNIGLVVADKLKTRIGEIVKEKEKLVMRQFKTA